MRLDKFLSNMGKATRKESATLAKAGKIEVNGKKVARVDFHIDEQNDEVKCNGQVVPYQRFTYLLLNKPQGVVSATEDPNEQTVIDLLPPELQRLHLFPCGRLDKNTVGLVILTNDGENGHRWLSPKYHVAKRYRFTCEKPLSADDENRLRNGVDIGDYVTKPCQIVCEDDRQSGQIVLTEGKYHQIKRMFEAVENKITFLERVSFGAVTLEKTLPRGAFRPLSNEELSSLLEEK